MSTLEKRTPQIGRVPAQPVVIKLQNPYLILFYFIGVPIIFVALILYLVASINATNKEIIRKADQILNSSNYRSAQQEYLNSLLIIDRIESAVNALENKKQIQIEKMAEADIFT